METNPLQSVIDDIGLLPFAKSLGVSYQAIRKWQAHGVPAERVIQICEIAKFKVTPHQIRPDLYPNRLDAIPQGFILGAMGISHGYDFVQKPLLQGKEAA